MASRSAAHVSLGLVDKAALPTTFEFWTSTAANLAYQTNPVAAGAVRDLLDAALAMTLLNKTGERATRIDYEFPTVYPTDDQAYRSSKLLITWQDVVTGQFGTSTLPGRDPAAYNTYPRSKDVILTIAQGGTAQTEAFFNAFETGARSDLGNLLTILEIKVAGRAS